MKPTTPTITAPPAQEPPVGDIALMRRLLKAAGIDLEKARQRVEEEDAETRRREERAAYEAAEREKRRLKILDIARRLVESGGLLIKIDRELSSDIDVPCPMCGHSLDMARGEVYRLSELVWEGDPFALAMEKGGRALFVLDSFECPSCKSKHSVSLQLVV